MDAPETAVRTACPVEHAAHETIAEPARAVVPPPRGCPVDHTATAAPAEPTSTAIPASELPRPDLHPVKQILRYWRQPSAFMEECRDSFGDRFALSIRLPAVPLYVLTDPDDVKAMFLAPPDVLHTGTGSATIEKFTGQTGLAWLDEDAHKARRRLLMPSFNGRSLQRIETAIDTAAKEEVASWPAGTVTSLHPHIHRFTLDVIREVIFGPDTPTAWPELKSVLTRMMDFNYHMTSPMAIHKMPPRIVKFLTWFRPSGLRTFLQLRERADQLIASAVAERRASGSTGEGMLAVLLGITHDDGSPLDATELRDEMMTIFIAGTETTAAAIAWCFEYLSRHDDALATLVEEIDRGESDAYLTAVVNEVLRLRPSIPQIIPRTVMKPIEIGGVRYEPGMLLWASAYLLNRNRKTYDAPDEFRPERFVGVKPGSYTWIPFGGGRIRCLGDKIAILEMTAMLREVLTRYALHRDDKTPEGPRSRIVVTVPARGTRLELRTRETAPTPA